MSATPTDAAPTPTKPEMQTVLHNLAATSRDRWTRCSYSRDEAFDYPDECSFHAENGAIFRAVKGRRIGRDYAQAFRIFAELSAGEKLKGRLVDEPYPSLDIEDNPPAFVPHPWVADDLEELIPKIVVEVAGVRYETGYAGIRKIDESAAHQRYHVRSTIPELGFVFDWWADVCHLDPVIECWGRLVWSTRTTSSVDLRVDAIALKTGELYIDTFGKMHGCGEPFSKDRNWYLPVSGPRNFVDGSGLPFYGQMLAYISDFSNVPVEVDAEVDNRWIARSLRSLDAARKGLPVVGTSIEWDGLYLAAQNVPRYEHDEDLENEKERAWADFMEKRGKFGDYYEDRTYGSEESPSQTGDQDDFGATKGTFVVSANEPKMLLPYQWSAYADCVRAGAALFEGGKPLDPAAHPDWRTWSGITHWHPGVSPDRLGKDFGNWGATGWHNYDDQHRSQNTLAAVIALHDDPLGEAIMLGFSIPDANMLDNRVGATRAVGRLFGAWAQFLLLSDPKDVGLERWHNRVAEKLRTLHAHSRLSVQGDVKVIGTGHPDLRKQVYYPAGHPRAGELAHWWSNWEHGLFACGAYKLWKVTQDEGVRGILETVVRTCVNYGMFQIDGTWYVADDLTYLDDGEPLHPSAYHLGSDQLVVSPGLGGTTFWAFQAVLIAAEMLRDQTGDVARECVRQHLGGREASTRRAAEWLASVTSVDV